MAGQQGLARRVEAAWRVGGVLACRVGSACPWWWVGSGGLACRLGAAWWVGGGRMEVARLHKKPAMSSVLHAVLGQQSGLAVAGCRGRMEVARVREWPAMSVQGFACRVGAAWWVGSGGVLGQGRMKAAHVHEWPATSRGGAAGWQWRRVGGGGMLRAMSGRRVGAGTNGGSSRARGGGNGLLRSG
ncbi:hypothetical protein EDB86DRAFT_2829365 [Lactarius hatsudake]|nr:hypothetical protein EDB86DRAFT_2829365 [Lactarius hatsudake]